MIARILFAQLEGVAMPMSLGLALLVGAIVALGATASAQESDSVKHVISPGRGFSEQSGAELYANVCAACHQPDAKGAVGAGAYPALAGDKNLSSNDYVLSVLLNGQRGMPPVGQMMSDAQVADVINFVRTHFGNLSSGEVSAADVKAARPQPGSSE